MKIFKLFASVSFMAFSFHPLHAETHCPEQIDGVPLRSFQRAAMVVRAEVNNMGPYDFLLDTGAQITQIDPSLASELHLERQGTAGLVGVGAFSREVSLVELNELKAGSHGVQRVLAAVQNLNQLQTADQDIRGVLGENFLRNFDVLIDYRHSLLCLDQTRRMEQGVKGERIPLIMPLQKESGTALPETLVIPVHVSGGKEKNLRLLLDSGSSSPLLYCRHGGKEVRSEKASIRWAGADGTEQRFAVLAPQDLQIGARSISRVSFVAPIGIGNDVPEIDADGLLPTALFRRVYISYANRYTVFDPR